MGLKGLRELNKKNQKQFEQNKELVEKMRKGLSIKLINALSSGTVCYKCPITKQVYTLDRYQQSLIFNFEQFNALVNNNKNILKNFILLPVECEIEGYEHEGDSNLLNEVLKIFGLSKIYEIEEVDGELEGGDFLYEESIDDILLSNDIKYKEFVNILDEVPIEFLEKITRRAIDLVASDELTDNKKIKCFIDITDNSDLFLSDYKTTTIARKLK